MVALVACLLHLGGWWLARDEMKLYLLEVVLVVMMMMMVPPMDLLIMVGL